MYRGIFSPNVIKESQRTKEEIAKELDYRITNKIPPGYKDAGKDDRGVGDVIIWMTILEVGKTRSNPLVFVTHEQKSDWFYRVNNRGILPRYELLISSQRVTRECVLHCILLGPFEAVWRFTGRYIGSSRRRENNPISVERRSYILGYAPFLRRKRIAIRSCIKGPASGY